MTSHSKQQTAEPTIVVDPSMARGNPEWTSEETVLFRREMLDDIVQRGQREQPSHKQSPSLRPALLLSVALILCAIALRLFLRR